MRSVYFYDYDKVPITSDKISFFSSPAYAYELLLVEQFQGTVSVFQYFTDLDEYLNGVKKLYVKGDSEKLVPKQVWDITTRSFVTEPLRYVDQYNTAFEEF